MALTEALPGGAGRHRGPGSRVPGQWRPADGHNSLEQLAAHVLHDAGAQGTLQAGRQASRQGAKAGKVCHRAI